MKKVFELFLALVIVVAVFLDICFPKKDETKDELLLEDLRGNFSKQLTTFIPGEMAGLGLGYLLGEKDEMPENVKNEVKVVGMAHIVVVSGTHLGIILSFARRIFKNVSRLLTVYFSVFLLVFYVMLVGVSPSLVRASFVSVFGLIGWYFGRIISPTRMVLLTLSFCLIINPYFLSNLSFQLSMLAYSGIILFLPRMIRYFYGRDRPGFIASTILATLAAMISCLPIQLYYFGTFNVLTFVANLIILPTIPIVMLTCFLTGVFGLIGLKLFAGLFGGVSGLILDFHAGVIHFLADKTEFLLEFPKKQSVFLILYIVVVMAIVFLQVKDELKRKRRIKEWQNLEQKKLF